MEQDSRRLHKTYRCPSVVKPASDEANSSKLFGSHLSRPPPASFGPFAHPKGVPGAGGRAGKLHIKLPLPIFGEGAWSFWLKDWMRNWRADRPAMEFDSRGAGHFGRARTDQSI